MFLSTKVASDDRSPWGNFWFEPVSMRTMSNVRVTADSALMLSAVFRAVSLVSGHMAMLPIVFYESGTRKKIKHPLLRLLNRQPNRWQNAFEWRQMMQGHLELRGNCYNEIISDNRGNITDLIPRHPDKIVVNVRENGDRYYRYKQEDGTERTIEQGEMWHIRALSSNGVTGISVIEAARESIGLGLAAQSYGSRFFANDAKPVSGWVEFPGQFKDKNAKTVFREGIQEAQSAANRGKLLVLDNGMKYHEIGLSNTDSQFLENRKFQVTEVARWFGVPAHKLSDLERSTNNNIEQQALEYVQDGLLPRSKGWTSSIACDLLFDSEEIDVEHDFSELLRGDMKSRSEYINTGVMNGTLTRNEGRQIEGREPIPGLDEPLRPLNMAEEGEAEEETQEEEQQEQGSGQDNAANARLAMMIDSNARRLATRFVKTGVVSMEDSELVASSMACSEASADQWCRAFSETKIEASDADAICASLKSLS